ncbi:MAG: hypothetical protein U0441_13195 [Polyangiaceae bacterium]
MAERPDSPYSKREGHGGTDVATGTDTDLLVDRILGFAGAVVILVGVSAVTSWMIFQGEKRHLRAEDPPRSPIWEANERVIPPEPRLQTDPPADMRDLRAREDVTLHTYGWSDEQASTVHIPIERAIDLAANGVKPAVSDEETGSPPAGGAP